MTASPGAQPELDFTEPPVLDRAEGLRRRDVALRRVAVNHATWIDLARATGLRLLAERASITADDIRAVLYPRNERPAHPNAWGAVFKDPRFEWTGQFRPSAVPERKGNMVRIWRARGAGQ